MHDIRWFAPNSFCALPVPRLRDAGLSVATEGEAPARLVFLSDATLLRGAPTFPRRAPALPNTSDGKPCPGKRKAGRSITSPRPPFRLVALLLLSEPPPPGTTAP